MASTASAALKLNQKVHALKDLDGVPRGTKGKVLLIKGVEWKRYWVDFENGAYLPDVNRSDVATKTEWQKKRDSTEVEETVAAADGPVAAEAAPEGEAVGGIPYHLLERSKRARERLGPG
jgi:hypothetical protein